MHRVWGIAVIVVVTATTLYAASSSSAPTLVTRDVYLMGTRAHLAVWASTRADAVAKLDAAVRILEQAEEELSAWRPTSLISRLNRGPVGQPRPLPASICATLDTVRWWRDETGGAFDPAIGPLVDAWGIGAAARVPDARALAEARRRSGFHLLKLDAIGCVVTKLADVRLDTGAFGKGDALDRVRAALPDTSFMVDLGGQVLVQGVPPDRDAWDVDLAHPVDRDRAHVSVRVTSGSLATSAGSERDVQVGPARIGHILDPRTGVPAPFVGSVSVWHEQALVADILSTALYVLGVEEGLRFALEHRLAVCFLAPRPDGTVATHATPEFTRFQSRTARRASAPAGPVDATSRDRR